MNVQETVYEILVSARGRIADPEHWLKGCEATDAQGSCIPAWHPAACNFCSLGAIQAVYYGGDYDRREVQFAVDLYSKLFEPLVCNIPEDLRLEVTPKNQVVAFNDKPAVTHEMVLKMFDDAIALLSLWNKGY